MVQDKDIVGEALANVLPSYNKPWFRVPHLLKLNLILLVPLLSSAVAGYDGEQPLLCTPIPFFQSLTFSRLHDERTAGNQFLEKVLW